MGLLKPYGHPKNEPYYFSTASGESYSNVDYNFPTNGAGLTRNDNNAQAITDLEHMQEFMITMWWGDIFIKILLKSKHSVYCIRLRICMEFKL